MVRLWFMVGVIAISLVSCGLAEDNDGKLTVSGFMDIYFAYNTARPTDGLNALHNFTFNHNRASMQLVEVVVEQPMSDKRIGFRLDLNTGRTTEWVHAAEPGGRKWRFVQQAFVSIPLGKGYLDAGKFVTHHGAEVIESKDNWNYSRSLLFAWAIPYYHTGVRYWLPMGKRDKLCLHLYQGWNSVKDNNRSKSFGLMWQRSTDGYGLTVNYTGGAELPSSTQLRHLIDIVFTKPINKHETLMLNADWAHDNAASASWYGLAAYWRRQFKDGHFLTLRAEVFRDADGFTTGTKQTVKEVTLTYELPAFWLRSAFLLLEIRHDWSDAFAFDAGTKRRQTTFIAGIVLTF